MGRRPRVHFRGAFYHVIARGNSGQKIFRTDADYALYLSFLKEYKARFGFFLYAYVLMPTHLHLLIEVGEAPLSRIMQSLQFRYTRLFNARHGTWGHLFQGRYKALLCEKDSYFLELSAYIHLNPLRAGLVEEPSQYRWSSYPAYLKRGRKSMVDRDWLWAQFSNRKGAAGREYERFVKERMTQGHRDDFYEVKDQRFLGSEEFVEEIHRDLEERPSFVYEVSLPEMVQVVSSLLKIPRNRFYSLNRNREGAWGRAIVGYLGRRWGGHPVKAMAEYFYRDPAVLSQGMRRVEEKIARDESFAKTMAAMEEALIQGGRRRILI